MYYLSILSFLSGFIACGALIDWKLKKAIRVGGQGYIYIYLSGKCLRFCYLNPMTLSHWRNP